MSRKGYGGSFLFVVLGFGWSGGEKSDALLSFSTVLLKKIVKRRLPGDRSSLKSERQNKTPGHPMVQIPRTARGHFSGKTGSAVKPDRTFHKSRKNVENFPPPPAASIRRRQAGPYPGQAARQAAGPARGKASPCTGRQGTEKISRCRPTRPGGAGRRGCPRRSSRRWAGSSSRGGCCR